MNRMKTIASELVPVIVIVEPTKRSKTPVWGVPLKKDGFAEIRDEFWSATFGICQETLADITDSAELIVDFSRLCWIDPFPLLSIFIAVKTCCVKSRSHLTVLLGNEPVSNRDIMIRGGFLKFVCLHGFLSNLKDVQDVCVRLGSANYAPDDEALYEKLDSARYMMAYPDSICLEAIIEPITNFQNEDAITQKVTRWTDRIKESRIGGFFEGEPDKFDDLTTKIHILLVEILLNAGEHAYRTTNKESSSFVGLYARLREPAGQQRKNRLQSDGYITAEAECCPGFRKFGLSSHDSTWLEFFFVDQGHGLIADLDKWIENAPTALKSHLKKKSSNPLHQIGRFLFQEPLSRHNRADRTMLTGLQYVRNSLSENEESARLYSHGEWVAEQLPWHPDRAGQAHNLAKRRVFFATDNRAHCAMGTSWQFCLNLDAPTEQYGDPPPGWEKITSSDVRLEHSGRTQPSDWQMFDDRNLGEGIKSRKWHEESFTTFFSLWLPELVRKNQVRHWIDIIFRQKIQDQWVWIFADMSRKDASLMDSVLSTETYSGRRISVRVYMVTRDWCVKCYKSITSIETGKLFEQDEEQAHKVKQEYGGFILQILRNHDSGIFWQGLLEQDTLSAAFIPEEIIWERGEDKKPKVILNGYLDLTQALLDPARKFVARRALERTWLLYANKAECVAADPLLTDLLPGDARMTLQEQSRRTGETNHQIIVSSVFVTGKTAQRASLAGQSAIHLLHHSEVKGPVKPMDSRRCALDWLEQDIKLVTQPENKLPYERLPGTPYISRGGPKAAPIRRFVKKGNDLFAESVYGKDPQQTYRDMIRFDLLKLGHWVYGAHHDLLTMNLAYSVESKRFYKDTATEWILGELKKQAQHEGGQYRVLVVYASHAVTDKLVEAVKKITRGYEAANLTFIPVRFWATHTQTAIRIPSLTYDRIRKELTYRKTRVVLLDDGAVTGKVQREMEQLLCNAGAEEVIHLGLVTRTGLPLYRKYLESHRNSYRYYWRWDVPPLGNAATCPLCRAIDQARELARRMWNEEAKIEVEQWVSTWEACSVTSHWGRHGLSPGQLPDTRLVTFGKDWLGGDEPKKYTIEHGTTTGLAATVMEIIRTTSYKGVGLKLARTPWEDEYTGDRLKWRDAQLEILICQLFIYYDDFDEEEIQERFQLLLEILLAPSMNTDNPDRTKKLEYLGCLALLMATDKQVDILTNRLWLLLVDIQNAGDNLLLILGVLVDRAGTYNRQKEALKCSLLEPAQQVRVEALLTGALLFSQGKEVKGTRHALFSLYLLFGKNDQDCHAGFFRKKLTGEISADKREILRDLKTIEQALREIDPHIISGSSSSSFDPIHQADKVHNYIVDLQQDVADYENLKRKILLNVLDGVESTGKLFRQEIIFSTEDIKNLLERSINQSDWEKRINDPLCKKHDRWTENQYLPYIHVPINKVTDQSKVYVVCPLMFRTMIKEFLYNVMHSSDRITENELECDMCCVLDIRDNVLVLDMINLADSEEYPKIKPSEGVVSAQLIKNPVEKIYCDNKMTVTVRLPLIEHLYRSEQ